jgi:acyl-coenzyme A synthetase/AMP-(fatty) acid ligase
LKQIFSCGAPVPADVLRSTLACVGKGAKMHTPYGATECLPVSTIEASQVLDETASRTNQGAGVCVGRKFDSIDWRVIHITDDPIATIDDAAELPTGEIGELIVRGPQVSPKYVTRFESNAQSKVADRNGFWHRTGDVGYFDKHSRFWYCGRKSQRVEVEGDALFTECIEAVVNTHFDILRSALVGVIENGRMWPIVVVEPKAHRTSENLEREILRMKSTHSDMGKVRLILTHPRLPVDIRHNAKIRREELAQWATRQLTQARHGGRSCSNSHAG